MKEEQALKDLLTVQKKKEKIVIWNDQLIVENFTIRKSPVVAQTCKDNSVLNRENSLF